MSDNQKPYARRFGNLIRLRPEYEERYLILHRHPFPGVLQRLRESRITNYSIFLDKNILFSYHEYRGSDYQQDMQAVADESVTQDWWKLTDPMQNPFYDRRRKDWWYALEEVGFGFSGEQFSDNRISHAFTAKSRETILCSDRKTNIILDEQVIKFALFRRKNVYFVYFEFSAELFPSDSFEPESECLKRLEFLSGGEGKLTWVPMRMIFHLE